MRSQALGQVLVQVLLHKVFRGKLQLEQEDMAATLTLFEHEATSFEWTDHHLESLERLSRATGADVLQAIVHGRQRKLRAQQMVGVVRFGSHTVQVLPKIYRTDDDKREQAREATCNLLYLLAYAGQLPVHEYALAPLLRRGLDWFEILTHLFASHLLSEWQRGAYRGYQAVEDELSVLKGKWRFADQLRRPERRHSFAVVYDEFTADNKLNRVFRFVVERLWYLTHDVKNRRMLGELRHWMDDVTLLSTVTVAEASPALLTRLNQHYEPLLNLARLFLAGGALQLAAGELTAFAFVFDMNQLFEAFLVNFIRRHRQDILPPDLQRCDLLPQSRGATLYLARTESRSVFQLRPDLAFRKDRTFPILLDAKYKRLSQADAKLGVSQDDFYQMHAYAHRYDCPLVLLIYPQTADMPEPLYSRFTLESNSRVIAAATIDVRAELRLRSERQRLIRELKQILGSEDDIQQ
jgi:5-methylcytosine-specific restriction enzyme subunit McrC